MSQPYVGQIIMFAGTFAPAGWALCQGQTIQISDNDTLFNLIGTTYGGDGQETFQLPDLQSRVPIHNGQGGGLSSYTIGQTGGLEGVTLTTNQIPVHTHLPYTTAQLGTTATPASNTILADEGVNNGTNSPLAYAPYNSGTPNQVQLPGNTIANTGGSQPHNNIQPVLALNFCIALYGVYPSVN